MFIIIFNQSKKMNYEINNKHSKVTVTLDSDMVTYTEIYNIRKKDINTKISYECISSVYLRNETENLNSCIIRSKDNKTIKIRNFTAIAEEATVNEDYKDFIIEFHKRISHNTSIALKRGNEGMYWISILIVIIASLLLLGYTASAISSGFEAKHFLRISIMALIVAALIPGIKNSFKNQNPALILLTIYLKNTYNFY